MIVIAIAATLTKNLAIPSSFPLKFFYLFGYLMLVVIIHDARAATATRVVITMYVGAYVPIAQPGAAEAARRSMKPMMGCSSKNQISQSTMNMITPYCWRQYGFRLVNFISIVKM